MVLTVMMLTVMLTVMSGFLVRRRCEAADGTRTGVKRV
jgi:hypothetical protein